MAILLILCAACAGIAFAYVLHPLGWMATVAGLMVGGSAGAGLMALLTAVTRGAGAGSDGRGTMPGDPPGPGGDGR